MQKCVREQYLYAYGGNTTSLINVLTTAQLSTLKWFLLEKLSLNLFFFLEPVWLLYYFAPQEDFGNTPMKSVLAVGP